VQRPPAAGSAAAEEALRQAYDSADRALGGQGLARFSDLFAVPNWVCNLVELDPYSSLRPAPAAGPLQLPSAAGADGRRSGPPGPGANVFVYAKPSPALPTLMDALAPRCRQLELFIGNAPAHIQNPWPHVRLHRTPVDLSARLPEFSAVVHFGGMNLAAEALFAGVPQLVLPHHLEQAATGMAVQRLGTGHCLATFPMEPEQEPARHSLISGLVDRFFADTGLPARAAALGADLRARQKPSLEGLVALCEAGF
jgi:hypothetical protein